MLRDIPEMESGGEAIYQGRGDFLRKHKNNEVFSSHGKMYNVYYNLLVFIILGHCFYEESTG